MLKFVLGRVHSLLQRSYAALKSHHHSFHLRYPKRTRAFTLAAIVPIFGAVAAFGFAPLAPDAADVPVHEIELALASIPVAAQVQSLDLASATYRHEEMIGRGDTLGTLLTRLGVDDPAAEAFIRTNADARALYQLRPGKRLAASTDDRGNLVSLSYHFGDSSTGDGFQPGTSDSLIIDRSGASFTAHQEHAANDRVVEMRSGEVTSSLYGATDAAGVPDQIANQIADIFAGDIDFYRDLRRGDHFRVVYESFQHEGEPVRAGRVLAVEFATAGKLHQAVWYQASGQSSGNYYGFDGHSLRRAFLRAPLQFTRISSGFGGRVHPILNIWKWHTGIDYAAPIGTPIRATADGVVKFIGQQTGYGNAIELKHQGVYSTLYGHMSAFAKGLRAGQPVTQGQVIGYVGMTGWATGPHLHYEFRINGVAKDPLHVAMPDALPITHDQLTAFHANIAPLDGAIARMRLVEPSTPVPAPRVPAA